MSLVVGVDGCPQGWCAVMLDSETLEASAVHYNTFAQLNDELRLYTIAIDIPIGLPDCAGGRDCDREARAYLGWPRRASVFSPPARATLHLCGQKDRYREACDVNRGHTERAISQQSFGIGPKIREVDHAMTPTLEKRVYEAHPEVSFAAMNGRPMVHRKSTPEGRAERWAVLRGLLGQLPERPARPPELGRACDLEDYIDAVACAWTAKCVEAGSAHSFPEDPLRDAKGLRMAIWVPLARTHRPRGPRALCPA
jgi:predicted RNase H-like nuclease